MEYPNVRLAKDIEYRCGVWKLLLKYMPTNGENQLPALARKRKEYFVMVNTYI